CIRTLSERLSDAIAGSQHVDRAESSEYEESQRKQDRHEVARRAFFEFREKFSTPADGRGEERARDSRHPADDKRGIDRNARRLEQFPEVAVFAIESLRCKGGDDDRQD